MKKYFILLLIALSFAAPGLNSIAESRKNQSTVIDPTPTPLAEIERIDLDKNEALIPCLCRWGKTYKGFPNGCGTDENGDAKKDNFLIKVKTFARNPKNLPLVYEYAVSGGQITGQGNEIIWNLEGNRPGTYTITASIKSNRRVSPVTKTGTVIVRECGSCDCACLCPSLVVSGGGGVKPGESVTFEAHVSGDETENYSFHWTVSKGEIIEGQGTQNITVKTTREMDGEIIATVEISADGLCESCLRTASENAFIIKWKDKK